MKATVVNLDNKKVGEVDLLDAVFGVEERSDVLARAVYWQQAKKRAGTHKTKGISEISGTTRKPWAQKGSGRARQGSLRSPQFRKGAVIFGPVVRSHAHDLPKKFRRLALCMALAGKLKAGKLIVLDAAKSDSPKTKDMIARLGSLGASSALIIDGANLDKNFALAIRNMPFVDLLPEQGANVYDILRHETLVLTRNAVEQLQARLTGQDAGQEAA
ncbi:MAG: 50S ribosomal protein L4 [Alphaproteobacteria bacterium]